MRSWGEHEEFVEQLVRGTVDALDTSFIDEEGAFSSQLEAAECSFKELRPEELESQLEDAVGVLEGLCTAVEVMNSAVVVVLTDATNRARLAHRRAELALGKELDELD